MYVHHHAEVHVVAHKLQHCAFQVVYHAMASGLVYGLDISKKFAVFAVCVLASFVHLFNFERGACLFNSERMHERYNR